MTAGRILYVEDNFDNRILIKRVLEAEGYTVVEADSGTRGVELARTSNPDLVLMDINLPDIDGYECTQRLRRIESTRSVPILALTANVLEGDRQKALSAGCDGYISKPIDVDDLPKQIQAHMSRSRPVSATSAEHQQDKLAPASQPAEAQTAVVASSVRQGEPAKTPLTKVEPQNGSGQRQTRRSIFRRRSEDQARRTEVERHQEGE